MIKCFDNQCNAITPSPSLINFPNIAIFLSQPSLSSGASLMAAGTGALRRVAESAVTGLVFPGSFTTRDGSRGAPV